MANIDVVVLPLMYVCTLVTGALIATCGRQKKISELEDQIDNLQWDLAVAQKKLEDAADQLTRLAERMSDNDEEEDAE